MHFSLVKINRNQDSTPNGLDDAIFPLYFGLKSLGFQVEILYSRVNPTSQNIIFGSSRSPLKISRLLPSNSIIFNLEQMFESSRWNDDNYLKQLQEFEVWDYSTTNIKFLQSKNISATHVPIGYVPEMSRISKSEPSKIDVLFYGSLDDRRKKVITGLKAAKIQACGSDYVFGNSRDSLLASTKTVINIHMYLPARLEIVRLGYVWANKIPVISERNSDTAIPHHLEEACIYAPYEELVEETKRIIHDDKRLLQQAEIGFKAFSSEKMSDILRQMLGCRTYAMAHPPQIKTSEKIRNLTTSFRKFIIRKSLNALQALRGQKINSFVRSRVTKELKNTNILEVNIPSQSSTSTFEWHIKEDMTP